MWTNASFSACRPTIEDSWTIEVCNLLNLFFGLVSPLTCKSRLSFSLTRYSNLELILSNSASIVVPREKFGISFLTLLVMASDSLVNSRCVASVAKSSSTSSMS
ncbi:hypothetical protein HanRHA438_Chr13g0620261 [Helianthus annuus]|nr:hypothetical protein HanRHA438_Chr13g0620261 [Helianthus annuus]